MQIFNEAPVLASEIDRLGHMNVQYYMERAGKANAELLRAQGLTPALLAEHTATLRQTDSYCRFHREQFVGAMLQVAGGLLDIDQRRAKVYIEIRNQSRNQIAATFIIDNAMVKLADRTLLDLPSDRAPISEPTHIAIPAHGRPRSLHLDPPRTDINLAELQSRIVDLGPIGMMSGQFERAVDAAECDEHGFLREGANLMFGGRRPQPDEDGSFGPPVLRTDEGHRFGWAIMETRSLVFAAPRAGDVLVSIGADVAIAAKSRHSRRWTFRPDTGQLVGINDAVAVALDLDERRAIEIPQSIQSVIKQNYFPEYT